MFGISGLKTQFNHYLQPDLFEDLMSTECNYNVWIIPHYATPKTGGLHANRFGGWHKTDNIIYGTLFTTTCHKNSINSKSNRLNIKMTVRNCYKVIHNTLSISYNINYLHSNLFNANGHPSLKAIS